MTTLKSRSVIGDQAVFTYLRHQRRKVDTLTVHVD